MACLGVKQKELSEVGKDMWPVLDVVLRGEDVCLWVASLGSPPSPVRSATPTGSNPRSAPCSTFPATRTLCRALGIFFLSGRAVFVFAVGGVFCLVPTARKYHQALCIDMDLIYKVREEHARSHLL